MKLTKRKLKLWLPEIAPIYNKKLLQIYMYGLKKGDNTYVLVNKAEPGKEHDKFSYISPGVVINKIYIDSLHAVTVQYVYKGKTVCSKFHLYDGDEVTSDLYKSNVMYGEEDVDRLTEIYRQRKESKSNTIPK